MNSSGSAKLCSPFRRARTTGTFTSPSASGEMCFSTRARLTAGICRGSASRFSGSLAIWPGPTGRTWTTSPADSATPGDAPATAAISTRPLSLSPPGITGRFRRSIPVSAPLSACGRTATSGVTARSPWTSRTTRLRSATSATRRTGARFRTGQSSSTTPLCRPKWGLRCTSTTTRIRRKPLPTPAGRWTSRAGTSATWR